MFDGFSCIWNAFTFHILNKFFALMVWSIDKSLANDFTLISLLNWSPSLNADEAFPKQWDQRSWIHIILPCLNNSKTIMASEMAFVYTPNVWSLLCILPMLSWTRRRVGFEKLSGRHPLLPFFHDLFFPALNARKLNLNVSKRAMNFVSKKMSSLS